MALAVALPVARSKAAATTAAAFVSVALTACGAETRGIGAAADSDGGDSNGPDDVLDAGRKLDASADAKGGEATSLPQARFVDARPDDFEALPEQTETNLGPGARPSDYPEAGHWQEPAPPVACCTPASAPIKLDPAEWDPRQTAMAWADGVFGVSWLNEGSPPGSAAGALRFRTVDPNGLVVSALEEPVEAKVNLSGYFPSLVWANGRFALAYRSRNEADDVAVYTAILNRHGYAPWGGVQSDLPTGADDPHVARYTAEGVWLVAAGGFGTELPQVIVSAVDDRGSPDGRGWVPIGSSDSDSGHIALAGLKSRAFLVWGRGSGSGFSGRSFSWPYDAETAGPEFSILATSESTESSSISAAAFRDVVITALISGRQVLTFSIDPWTSEILSGPHQVGGSRRNDAVLGIGAAEKEGYLGLCYGRGDEGDTSLLFLFLGPDGRPRSPEYVLTTGQKRLSSCAVGFDGKNWAVAWRSIGNEFPNEDLEFQLLRSKGG